MLLFIFRALNTMVYYGLSYNTPNLYGDMYLNFFIGQMVEIPSVIATLWLIYKSVYHIKLWHSCFSNSNNNNYCHDTVWIQFDKDCNFHINQAIIALIYSCFFLKSGKKSLNSRATVTRKSCDHHVITCLNGVSARIKKTLNKVAEQSVNVNIITRVSNPRFSPNTSGPLLLQSRTTLAPLSLPCLRWFGLHRVTIRSTSNRSVKDSPDWR